MIEVFILKTVIDGRTFYLSENNEVLTLSSELSDATFRLIRLSALNTAKMAKKRLNIPFAVVDAELKGETLHLTNKGNRTRYSNLIQ